MMHTSVFEKKLQNNCKEEKKTCTKKFHTVRQEKYQKFGKKTTRNENDTHLVCENMSQKITKRKEYNTE